MRYLKQGIQRKRTLESTAPKYILFYNALHKTIFTQESTYVVISAMMWKDMYVKDIFEITH